MTAPAHTPQRSIAAVSSAGTAMFVAMLSRGATRIASLMYTSGFTSTAYFIAGTLSSPRHG